MKNKVAEAVFDGASRVGFLGLGRSNLAILRMLCELKEPREVILRSDNAAVPEPAPLIGATDSGDSPGAGSPLLCRDLCRCAPYGPHIAAEYFGKSALEEIREDMLILSPSVRRDRAELISAVERGVILTSDAELFFGHNSRPIIAVTGSDGKSTTVTMAAEMLGKRGRLAGNIGIPLLPLLAEPLPQYFVCELSSFTLQYAVPETSRAAVTNITPNHLNWHKDLEEYSRAKLALLKKTEEAVVSVDDALLADFALSNGAYAVTSAVRSFDELRRKYSARLFLTVRDGSILLNGEPFIDRYGIAMKESHNLRNLLTAVGLCYGLADEGDISACARSFRGLPHRCERFLSVSGVDFIDSSIDTSPARTAATLASVGEGAVLILGGRGKGLSCSTLVEPIRKHAAAVIIYGEDCRKMAAELSEVADRITVVEDATDAFRAATEAGLSKGATAVLLSPAATSFDRFSSFEERGDHFKNIVRSYFQDK